MGTLFDLPIGEITAARVTSFLAGGVAEAERHEYKSEWDDTKVGSTICAFANTSGGFCSSERLTPRGLHPIALSESSATTGLPGRTEYGRSRAQ